MVLMLGKIVDLVVVEHNPEDKTEVMVVVRVLLYFDIKSQK
jgi:hypothetical protein|tara:strand:- start:11 stop:133 length:123 start_codon:yes stop_codon:yes gene_type:complete